MPTRIPSNESVSDGMIEILLEHIARYRMTVPAAVATLPSTNGRGLAGAKLVLRECRQQSLVDSAPLHGRSRYWFLTASGANRCSVTVNRDGPLSETAKIRAFALLHFCCLSGQPRLRLTADDIRQNFPDLYRPGLPTGYYYDPAHSGRLGLARVDASQGGRWDRVIETLRSDITDHLRQPSFKRLAEAGRFEITLLTVFPEKADRIRTALARHRDLDRVPIRIESVPDLLPVILSLR
ncbi:MAG: hypothetical protein R3C18_02820 [Planctomycetaceae bacterium]